MTETNGIIKLTPNTSRHMLRKDKKIITKNRFLFFESKSDRANDKVLIKIEIFNLLI